MIQAFPYTKTIYVCQNCKGECDSPNLWAFIWNEKSKLLELPETEVAKPEISMQAKCNSPKPRDDYWVKVIRMKGSISMTEKKSEKKMRIGLDPNIYLIQKNWRVQTDT